MNTIIKNRILAVTIALLLWHVPSFGQSTTSKDDEPKVGLVLSGGGAKGLAHIGVLKVLDSLGVKIDRVAGTSMGAVVGGLYASGYSGKQLDSLFKLVDFDQLIIDEIPRSSKTFYEREISEKYALSLPFDNLKLQLPSAISKGQNVYNLFSNLLLHVSDIDNFEDLSIPFFCIGTNVENGEPVILNKGNLPQAIAASGAIPSLFQPVEIDGKLIIDGGVVNNYPIDELRAKGMDIIIGVDVQDSLATRKELSSAPEILLQVSNFRTIKDMKVKAKKTDIYIKPDIKDFNVVSFDEGRQIIDNGYKAAINQIEVLKNLPKRPYPTSQKTIQPVDSILINQIRISGNETYTQRYIRGKLKLREGEKVSYEDFKVGVNNLIATNNFDSFTYDFEPDADGYILEAHVAESKNTSLLKLGIHYDDLYKSAALINYTNKRLLIKNDVLSLDLILGDHIRYNFDYFVDNGFYWSVGLRSRYNHFDKNVNAGLLLSFEEFEASEVNKIDVDYSDFTNQFYVQTSFVRDFALTLGAEHKRLNITSETILPDGDEEETVFEKSDFFSLFGKLKFDSFDNKYFPNNGFLFDGDFHWYVSSSNLRDNFSPFSIAKANIAYAFSLTNRFSTVIGSEGGFKIGDDSVNSLNFALGGYGNDFINNFISFYGYDFIALTGNSFVKGYIDLDFEWLKKHHIILSANYSNIGEDIFQNSEWLTSPDFSGYAIGYSLETFIGPIEAKYSWSPETKGDTWFFNIGFWF